MQQNLQKTVHSLLVEKQNKFQVIGISVKVEAMLPVML